jgi:hypothetical protein
MLGLGFIFTLILTKDGDLFHSFFYLFWTVVKHQVEAKLRTICGYPFFHAVGKPINASNPAIENWSNAINFYNSSKWKNCCLMARNALQRKVEQKSWERSQEWNNLAEDLYPHIALFVSSLVRGHSIPDKFNSIVIPRLSWDIMGICFECEYMDLIEPFFFIPLLEPCYAAGHLPCGWDGEEFPNSWDGIIREGKLIVY